MTDWERRVLIRQAYKQPLVILWSTQYFPHFAEAATPFHKFYLYKCPLCPSLQSPRSHNIISPSITACGNIVVVEISYAVLLAIWTFSWRKVISNKAVTWFVVALVFYPFTILKIHLIPAFSSVAPFLWPVYMFSVCLLIICSRVFPILFSWVIGYATHGIRDLQATQGWKKRQSLRHVRPFFSTLSFVQWRTLIYLLISELSSSSKMHHNLLNHLFLSFFLLFWMYSRFPPSVFAIL